MLSRAAVRGAQRRWSSAIGAVAHRLRDRRRARAGRRLLRGHRIDASVAGAFDVMLSVPALILALALSPCFLGTPTRSRNIASLALGIVSDPGARPHHAREHAVVVASASSCSRHARRARSTAASSSARCCPTCCRRCSRSRCSASRSRSSPRATLAILGASVETGTPTWGNMIATGRDDLEHAPHVVFEPALDDLLHRARAQLPRRRRPRPLRRAGGARCDRHRDRSEDARRAARCSR